jgi:hypothetical protein
MKGKAAVELATSKLIYPGIHFGAFEN